MLLDEGVLRVECCNVRTDPGPCKQRNLNDYEGDAVTDAAVRECLLQAEMLLAHTQKWLKTHRPDLLAETT